MHSDGICVSQRHRMQRFQDAVKVPKRPRKHLRLGHNDTYACLVKTSHCYAAVRWQV